MPDRALILGGLCLFLVLVTFPVWYALAAGSGGTPPEVRKGTGSACVAPIPYMRAAHMELLKEWREGKVRSGRDVLVAADGARYPVSLTATCLAQCHGTAEEFCNRCHSYAGIPVPDCWRCHAAPAAGPRSGSAPGRGAI